MLHTFARAPHAPHLGCTNAMHLCKDTACTKHGLQQCYSPLQEHHVHQAWVAPTPCTSARAPHAPHLGCTNTMHFCKDTVCTVHGLQQCHAPLQEHLMHHIGVAPTPCTFARTPRAPCMACSNAMHLCKGTQHGLHSAVLFARAPCVPSTACSSTVLRACTEDALQQRRAPCTHQGCAAALLCSVQSRSMHRGCAAA